MEKYRDIMIGGASLQVAKERYGIFTAITMIVGICIGSGIFFKSDNILVATGGSVFLGVLVFALGALAIIFGGLCLSQLASRTDKAGGVITYYEEFGSKRLACAFGWFQTFIYYPTITAVVSWVVGIYVCILFNLPSSFTLQLLIGISFCSLCFIYNTLSPKFGGAVQNVSTVIKLIPLFLIGILGFIYGNPVAGLSNVSIDTLAGTAWIAAVGPIAFSYDGWVVSTSVAHEVKNSKRNMPLALIIAPLFIFAIYVLYFVGVTSYIGVDKVMELEDAHVALAASQLFGDFGAKAIIIFVTISVMGTVNGLVLGFIRLPFLLALRGNVLPFAKALRVENKNLGMPVNAAIFAFAMTMLWTLLHYFTINFELLPNSDVSEISIAMSYLMYTILYYKVFDLYRKGEVKSVVMGVVVPLLATLGSAFILWGGMQNALFLYYAAFCLLLFAAAFVYFNINQKQGKETV